jgi:hypothetical protein
MKVRYTRAADTNIMNTNVKDIAQNGYKYGNDLSLSTIYVRNAEGAITVDLYINFKLC